MGSSFFGSDFLCFYGNGDDECCFDYGNGAVGFGGVIGEEWGWGRKKALVLDGSRGELVEEVPRAVVTEAKNAAALRSHSDAERRRRERINAHLNTLRALISGPNKMDKASLLAQVINHLRDSKRKADEISKGSLIPTAFDEVRVENEADGPNKEGVFLRVSLCCDDRPDLLIDLKRTLQNLRLKIISAEISTLGGRVKNVFVLTTCKENGDANKHQVSASSVHKALNSVVDRFSSSEYSTRNSFSSKRRRISLFNSSFSSS
ncbi:transcription factor bHLH30 [Amborella trichopoda]|uniref:transcription factor bHLH30 n=1 Tax=Amborella trichopoda TaxID=13333 RepID=UPI0005D45D36|nr:transcription factor bHLH30 [Amborella trichopoda]|eukprot:XP_011626267.1 transcription factor bHLH30 [Amborella trichopoda]